MRFNRALCTSHVRLEIKSFQNETHILDIVQPQATRTAAVSERKNWLGEQARRRSGPHDFDQPPLMNRVARCSLQVEHGPRRQGLIKFFKHWTALGKSRGPWHN
jgi:hypothetical protein